MRTDSVPRRGAVGRPAGPQPAKRQAILEAAVAVFLREGYTRASVDVIADEARVSKQTVYNHFGDKQRLFLAAVEGERERVAAHFTPDLEPDLEPDTDAQPDPDPGSGPGHGSGPGGGAGGAGDVRAALVVFGHRVLRVLLDERASALRRLVISEVARHPSLRPACADGEPQQLVSHLVALLTRRTERGELDVDDPATVARQFVALLVQQGLHQSMYGTRPLPGHEAAAICEKAADLFVRAYRR
ncbi:TetR/AcrR family transcriptional regulator [Streptomyces sparsogenes]|uniref:TetR family transcriptional regulator n=1 Tax=Streptomyces sparsogenes DSM 40356 TaxID=1331668 RepID=A0A1R1SPC8_9ACTN|nr:TetR/AcrR family transcriptional regulator [Streptomyces sparsogenes]OMI40158.1 TetR family transcriptional regulator [Streptomyces sparsogenes DSM 40356]